FAVLSVLPALALMARWQWVYRKAAELEHIPTMGFENVVPLPVVKRIESLGFHLEPIFSRYDPTYIPWLIAITIGSFCIARLHRRPQRPFPELLWALSALSYLVLPWYTAGQSVAERQVDVALALLPGIILLPRLRTRWLHSAVVVALVG